MTAVEKLAAEIIDIVVDSIEDVVLNALSNGDVLTNEDGKVSEQGARELTTLSKGVYYCTEQQVSLTINAWLSQKLAALTVVDTDTGGKRDGT